MHKSEKRRFLEGVAQRGKVEEEQVDEKRREAADESPAVYDRRREIEANQKAARQDLLDEVNADAGGAAAG